MSDHSSTKILLKNALIINRGHTMEGDILIKDKRIERVGKDISDARKLIQLKFKEFVDSEIAKQNESSKEESFVETI